MKKGLKILLSVIAAVILLVIAVFVIVSLTSKKMVCEKDDKKITIMYSETKINGYTAKNLSYNLDEQSKYAESIGIEKYIDEFEEMFEKSIGGTCKR